MTRRGGFRRGGGSDKEDTGFRLLPGSGSGKANPKAGTAAVYATTDTTNAAAAAGGGGGPSALLIGGLLTGGLGVIVIGAFAGYWLFTNLWFSLGISEAPLSVYLPPEFEVNAKVTNVLDIVMDGEITAQVPFKQRLNLPLKGRYEADVEINAPVPVKFDVVYDGTIPVDTIADITARANFNFQDVKTYRELEFKAKLPMKMALPVQLTAPVDTVIDFKYKGPLIMGLDQTIQADVDTVLNTRMRVNQTMSTPVTADIPLTIYAPHEPVYGYLTAPALAMNLDSLRLEVADDTNQPERVESQWGPEAVKGYHPQLDQK